MKKNLSYKWAELISSRQTSLWWSFLALVISCFLLVAYLDSGRNALLAFSVATAFLAIIYFERNGHHKLIKEKEEQIRKLEANENKSS